jgi:hypothetical protein
MIRSELLSAVNPVLPGVSCGALAIMSPTVLHPSPCTLLTKKTDFLKFKVS